MWKLETISKKRHCPNCGHISFKWFFDDQTKEFAPSEFGRCDREAKCGYHQRPPKQGGAIAANTTWKPPKPMPTVFIPKEVLQKTLSDYSQNTFVDALKNYLPENVIEQVVGMYYLGTTSTGANTFPFIDINGKIRAIQAKTFDKECHTTKTTFLHAIIKNNLIRQAKAVPQWLQDYEKQELKVSCLFGEHLLSQYPNNPIYLVEAPKTAIIGTCCAGFPAESQDKPLWLAVYNLSSLTAEKCAVLKGRDVTLIPDLAERGLVDADGKLYRIPNERVPQPHTPSTWGKAWHIWKEKSDGFANLGIKLRIATTLEKEATEEERQKGCDLADFLLDSLQ